MTDLCPTCGKPIDATVDDDCGAELHPNGHETITCWGIPHDGPHAAIQCSPCPQCGGFDQHADGCPNIGADTDPVSAWLQWDDDGTYWFVPGGWHSQQPGNIYWRGQRNFTASTSARPSTRPPTKPETPEPEAHPSLDLNTYLGLCEIAFAARSEGLGPTDIVATWLDDIGRSFGYQPTDTWPIWIVAWLTPSARTINSEEPQP